MWIELALWLSHHLVPMMLKSCRRLCRPELLKAESQATRVICQYIGSFAPLTKAAKVNAAPLRGGLVGKFKRVWNYVCKDCSETLELGHVPGVVIVVESFKYKDGVAVSVLLWHLRNR